MMRRDRSRAGEGQEGFALVLALLTLMLLTFLGLTLATSTSTEMQIATNYRWSQQAYYNAEAGMEAAKLLLTSIGDTTLVLPDARTVPPTWKPYVTAPATVNPTPRYSRNDAFGFASRNWENDDCDIRGNGVGYGAVLDDGGTPGTPIQNVSTLFGQTVNGAFTVWIRRRTQADPAGNLSDSADTDNVILVSEGSAPYFGTALGPGGIGAERRATRVLETEVQILPPCDPGSPEKTQTKMCW